MPELTVLDYGLAAALALGLWRGSRTGAVRQVAGLAGLIAAVWIGLLLMSPLGGLVSLVTPVPEELSALAAFVAVAFIIVLGVTIAAYLTRQTMDVLRLGFLDTGAGAVLGAARAALIVSVFLLVAGAPVLHDRGGVAIAKETRQKSLLYAPVAAFAPAVWRGLTSLSVPTVEPPSSTPVPSVGDELDRL